jgi:hypothetical protein
LKKADRQFIREAADYLENPSFLVRVTDLIGKPIEAGIEALPEGARKTITKLTQSSLEAGLDIAIGTIGRGGEGGFESGREESRITDWLHTAATAVTGGVGGFFGMAALPVELPITTGIMLRAIASIGDDFGHDLSDARVRLECLSVFAMGSPAREDDEMESAYFTTRIAMARVLEQAAAWIAGKSAREVAAAVANGSAPALIRFIAQVASRFEVVVTEKALAQALPWIGAATGAAINAGFSDHFNNVARFHFGILALEAKYGREPVRLFYESVLAEAK